MKELAEGSFATAWSAGMREAGALHPITPWKIGLARRENGFALASMVARVEVPLADNWVRSALFWLRFLAIPLCFQEYSGFVCSFLTSFFSCFFGFCLAVPRLGSQIQPRACHCPSPFLPARAARRHKSLAGESKPATLAYHNSSSLSSQEIGRLARL
jgi:hypothetical protein